MEQAGAGFKNALGKLLREAVQENSGACALFCIDDLDRCLPAQQVAILESLHFLSAAQPRAKIILAVDPLLLRESIASYYGDFHFDVDRYLEKILQYRYRIPAVTAGELDKLFNDGLSTQIPGESGELDSTSSMLVDMFNVTDKSEVLEAVRAPWSELELRNPRMIDSLFFKLRIIAANPNARSALTTQQQLVKLAWWLALTERLPIVRELREVYGFGIVLGFMQQHYVKGTTANLETEPGYFAFCNRVPSREMIPEMTKLVAIAPVNPAGGESKRADIESIEKIENVLRQCGI